MHQMLAILKAQQTAIELLTIQVGNLTQQLASASAPPIAPPLPPPRVYTMTGTTVGFLDLETGATTVFSAPMPNQRSGFQAVAFGDYIYAPGGGTSAVDRYHPKSDTWATVAPLPEPRRHHASVALGGYIYVIGGSTTASTKSGVRYDPGADTWTGIAPMGTARNIRPGAAALGGFIYMVRGHDGSKYTATVERYDPQSDSWEYVADSLVSGDALGAVVLNGRLYAAGGGGPPTKHLERYDPSSNTWTGLAGMPRNNYGLELEAWNGQLYAIGGQNGANALDVYDPTANTWTTSSFQLGISVIHAGVVLHPPADGS
jgi:hypothetical protein